MYITYYAISQRTPSRHRRQYHARRDCDDACCSKNPGASARRQLEAVASAEHGHAVADEVDRARDGSLRLEEADVPAAPPQLEQRRVGEGDVQLPGFDRTECSTSSRYPVSGWRSQRTSTAGSGSGTLCSRRIFMREAGDRPRASVEVELLPPSLSQLAGARNEQGHEEERRAGRWLALIALNVDDQRPQPRKVRDRRARGRRRHDEGALSARVGSTSALSVAMASRKTRPIIERSRRAVS